MVIFIEFHACFVRGTRIDLGATDFGFIEDLDCSLTIKLDGECHNVNDSESESCQPLLGFGDDANYFIISYLITHSTVSTNVIEVYPGHGIDRVLAEGHITSILTNYSGSAVGRDGQFYDAVTASTDQGEASFDILHRMFVDDDTESWPIELKIHRNESSVTIETADVEGHWFSSFGTNSSLHFGILDRLERADEPAFGGFTISLITISRSCAVSPISKSQDAGLLSSN